MMNTAQDGTVGSLDLSPRSTLRVFCTSTDRHAVWCGALAVTAHHTHGTVGHQGTPGTCEACFYGG